ASRAAPQKRFERAGTASMERTNVRPKNEATTLGGGPNSTSTEDSRSHMLKRNTAHAGTVRKMRDAELEVARLREELALKERDAEAHRRKADRFKRNSAALQNELSKVKEKEVKMEHFVREKDSEHTLVEKLLQQLKEKDQKIAHLGNELHVAAVTRQEAEKTDVEGAVSSPTGNGNGEAVLTEEPRARKEKMNADGKEEEQEEDAGTAADTDEIDFDADDPEAIEEYSKKLWD
ncbi:unnamed protein product, partial [Amoebophrya sp. A25]